MKTTTKTIKSIVIAGAILASSTLLADGATIYKKCAGCHGVKAQKHALGKSKVIANMSEDELGSALNGYKAGTYGGAMKGLMKGQVATLSKEDISSLSSYISSLKK